MKYLDLIFGWIGEVKTEIRIALGILLLVGLGLYYNFGKKDDQLYKNSERSNEFLREQLDMCQKENRKIREQAWQDKVRESERWERQREISDSINNLSKNKK